MKIYGIGYQVIRCVSETGTLHPDIPAGSKGNPVVNLSQGSNPNQRANNVIQLEPYIRVEKVRALRKQIERGTYQIDCDKIAEKMLGVFTDEIAGFAASFSSVCH